MQNLHTHAWILHNLRPQPKKGSVQNLHTHAVEIAHPRGGFCIPVCRIRVCANRQANRQANNSTLDSLPSKPEEGSGDNGPEHSATGTVSGTAH